MKKEIVKTTKAPISKAPFSQAVKLGNLVFCAGQVPVDPTTGQLVKGGIEVETRQVLNNLKAVLEAAGSSLEKALKVTVYMTNIKDWEKMNEVYRGYFPKDQPARTTVEVSGLAKDVMIEIDLVAHV